MKLLFLAILVAPLRLLEAVVSFKLPVRKKNLSETNHIFGAIFIRNDSLQTQAVEQDFSLALCQVIV